MANEEHLELLKQGVAQWNEWREQHRDIQPDLSSVNLWRVLQDANLRWADLHDANLRGANLIGSSLIGADLRNANLRWVNLSRADLRDANLRDADLSNADLIRANLSSANLSSADLSKADLSSTNLSKANLSSAETIGVNLSNANLSGANLSEARLYGANLRDTNVRGAVIDATAFANVDLREIKGLAELHHRGPSYVALHTILLPQDGSALHFLRGAGVPDEWIDDYRARMMHPIQYHSCFISYSGKDEMLARRLYADLQAQGVRCWFAPEDLKIGDKFRNRIDEAIHVQEKLLLILSKQAIESDWVEVEVESALEKEKRQKREVLFPIRIDESMQTSRQAWAKHLRLTRHIGDFTKWTNPQAYQQAFERLLRDLKKTNEQQDQETKQ